MIQLDRKDLPAQTGLKIGLLCYDALSSHDQDLLVVRYKLQEMGFIVIDAPKTIQALGGDVRKIAKVVSKMEVDAWIVRSGPKDLLQWMAGCGLPTFAVFGIQKGIKVAGALPDHRRAVGHVVDRFVAMGHTRIVLMVARSIQGSAGAGRTEQVFLDGLRKANITVGEYNLPRWKENPDDYRRCLESLFQFTPPTAMIIEEATFLFAAIQFCGEKGIRIPQDVSMVCLQYSETMAMGKPSIAHMTWESQSLVRRVLSWAEHVAKGIADYNQLDIPVKYIDGDSSGF